MSACLSLPWQLISPFCCHSRTQDTHNCYPRCARCSLYAMRCTRRACMCVCMCDRQDQRPSLSLPPSLPFSPAFPCFTFYHPSPFISVPFSFSHSPSFPLFCHRNARRKPQGKRKQEMCMQSWRRRRRRRRRRRHPSPKRKAFSHRKSGQIHTHTHAEELEKRPKQAPKGRLI